MDSTWRADMLSQCSTSADGRGFQSALVTLSWVGARFASRSQIGTEDLLGSLVRLWLLWVRVLHSWVCEIQGSEQAIIVRFVRGQKQKKKKRIPSNQFQPRSTQEINTRDQRTHFQSPLHINSADSLIRLQARSP